MSQSAVSFGSFRLDPANRRLMRDGMPVELNARYLDVLILLVDSAGDLVTKDRFMDAVWSGVPVTDEALTQAIRTLRRTLDDSAAAPRFIETVPKHGYRFIAVVEAAEGSNPAAPLSAKASPSHFIRQTLAGTGGALPAGALVGLSYGFIGAAHPQSGDGGAISLLLVLTLISAFSAGVAGAGISAGLAASRFIQRSKWYWPVVGGALGGVTMGAVANLIGSDAFLLLFGQKIGVFTGATEGFILGSAVGLAASLAGPKLSRSLGLAALIGACGGLTIALLGGRMMAGSLESLTAAFPSSQLRLDGITSQFGDTGFSPVGYAIASAFEGAVFTMGIIWGLTTVRTRYPSPRSR